MSFFSQIIDFFLHLDKHLSQIISDYGGWTYGILFLTIFCETGLVVTPFLPGDSLLFAAGALAAVGALNPHYLFLLLAIAGILGNTANYSIGRFIGPKVFTSNSRFFKKQYLEKANRFYDKHGGKAVIIGRFLPVLRTFVPFVAGIGAMTYARYTLFNVIGSALWVGLFVYAGYFFGNLPFIQKNFSLVIVVIIVSSAIPPVVEYFRQRRHPKT
ncbi:MAG: DedA family protein [candidate division Zixibacteria bacterium]|nr:DedA family protein [candidate division Zixibacteria bacterium]